MERKNGRQYAARSSFPVFSYIPSQSLFFKSCQSQVFNCERLLTAPVF
ncbi:hypothetical protein CLOSTHATH_03018 [Hungatella hathewayi DSM 13479]|uniref:Uncharacterized protein n=1 Tax=Hungatella hathewayi DSM 13479 TaxID=566550 RepID=D3AHD0_9FIRM|nr:hypothetical protein CLOSTHATH_03018 [Hungatella hathewayi DSM 13479]